VRIRITFEKNAALRFIGHLDLYKTWERTVRRARLPLAYSQGFHPHPRINLASALPLGFTSENEVVDIWLESNFSLADIERSIVKALPPGIHLKEIGAVEIHQPALQTTLEASEYLITFLEPAPGLSERIEGLLATERLPRTRRGRKYDLRPLILDIRQASLNSDNRIVLLVRLSARESATGRPEEVIEALGYDPLTVKIHRLRLIFRDDDPSW